MTTIQATQSGCEGRIPVPAQRCSCNRRGTGSRTQKSSMRPPECSRVPWEPALPLQGRQASTTSQPFLITTNMSCSSVYGVTPELIKCESLIVLAISHHLLLICIILVSISLMWHEGSNVITFLVKTNVNVIKHWPRRLGEVQQPVGIWDFLLLEKKEEVEEEEASIKLG